MTNSKLSMKLMVYCRRLDRGNPKATISGKTRIHFLRKLYHLLPVVETSDFWGNLPTFKARGNYEAKPLVGIRRFT